MMREATAVFRDQKFYEMVNHPLRRNTHPKDHSKTGEWGRFAATCETFVTNEFHSNRHVLWSTKASVVAHFVDVSTPSALLTHDGCNRQKLHTDFDTQTRPVTDAFSFIAVFGFHPRTLHIRGSVVTLHPGDYIMFGGHVVHAGGAFQFDCCCPASVDADERCRSGWLSLRCVSMGVHSYFRINAILPPNTGDETYEVGE